MLWQEQLHCPALPHCLAYIGDYQTNRIHFYKVQVN